MLINDKLIDLISKIVFENDKVEAHHKSELIQQLTTTLMNESTRQMMQDINKTRYLCTLFA